MSEQTQKPVRIRIFSQRYEVSASLFDIMLKSSLRDQVHLSYDDIYPASPEEEFMMGMMEDEDSESGIFVKPISPETLKAILSERETEDTQGKDDTEGIDSMEIYTEGYLVTESVRDGESISIMYDETELSGMEGSSCTITYCTDEPDLVHLIRGGAVTTAMTFKPHHRAICIYETSYMPFQVGIHCLSVKNTLRQDGKLKLDYIIEIKGAQAERCQMLLQIL